MKHAMETPTDLDAKKVTWQKRRQTSQQRAHNVLQVEILYGVMYKNQRR